MPTQIKPELAFAYAELLDILSFMEEKDVNKIPQKLMNIFKDYASTTYEKHINPAIPIEEQDISDETAGLLILLSINYWHETDAQKQELLNILKENDIKKEKELQQKYSYDKIFNNTLENESSPSVDYNKTEKITNISNLPVDYNSFPWYKKVFTKIKTFIYKLLKKENNPT